jgi:hypothetical protein
MYSNLLKLRTLNTGTMMFFLLYHRIVIFVKKPHITIILAIMMMAELNLHTNLLARSRT